MITDILLLLMITSYMIPIVYVYCKYNGNKSISNIICQEDCIFISMIIMGIFTIFYETQRNDITSLILIILLLLGIYGVILINENRNTHYLFASIVFISIIGFMINHYNKIDSKFLCYILYIQIILMIITCINLKKNILYCEILLLLNFAIYYIYLHQYNRNNS
jgi:hypothetical protein